VVKDNKLMRLLSPSDQSLLVEAFSPEIWAEGTTIICQGDAGDKFYIVESGETDLRRNGGPA
jgi:CRP-like cAMP-binding protein